MTKRMDEKIGALEYDGLICDNKYPIDVMSVKVAASQGVLARGSVLALSTGTAGTGNMALLGTTGASNETLTANCILADEVDTGTGDAVVATAYRSGHFVREAIVVKSGYTMTTADEEALRSGGIYLDNAVQ
jgi:hypothetical protein